MKRIIDGTTYNTDSATRVAAHKTEKEEAALYVTRQGLPFLWIIRLASEVERNLVSENAPLQALRPLTLEQANRFIETYNLAVRAPIKPALKARRWTIRVPAVLAEQFETAARTRGLSVNAYAMRCLEEGVGS